MSFFSLADGFLEFFLAGGRRAVIVPTPPCVGLLLYAFHTPGGKCRIGKQDNYTCGAV